MRKTAYTLFAAAALLLLVGAGCAAQRSADVKNGSQEGVSVDTAVDAILKNDSQEQVQENKVEEDASDVNGDQAELKGYSESTYELK